MMITEIVFLYIRATRGELFEAAFYEAQQVFTNVKGYLGHELQKCIETDNKYVLIVHWNTIEDHTEGFRNSDQYKVWKKLLHHFYDPFPVVEHYKKIF